MKNNSMLRSLFFWIAGKFAYMRSELMPQSFFRAKISTLKVILKEKYSLIETQASTGIMIEGLC